MQQRTAPKSFKRFIGSIFEVLIKKCQAHFNHTQITSKIDLEQPLQHDFIYTLPIQSWNAIFVFMLNDPISNQLDAIEAEMKKIGFWTENPPDFEAENYLKAPTFELWLQCVFIPNARKAVQTGKYPSNSEVGQMAFRQYDYHSPVPEAQHLLKLLFEFDKLIEEVNG